MHYILNAQNAEFGKKKNVLIGTNEKCFEGKVHVKNVRENTIKKIRKE